MMKRNIAFGKFPTEPSDARERARLEALDKLDIMDTPPDEVFDRIAGLITQIFGVEMSIVSFIDAHRQWYKASCGMGASQVGRRDSFCQYTLESAEPLIIRDASIDPRFLDHPAVVGAPYVRFYAGMPLRTREGHNVGTVCAIGAEPRMFSVEDERILADLTRLAMNFFELKQVAISDSLTGALTRRAFREEANRAVALVTRQRSELACIMVDIDHFKEVNDTYGHEGGDRALVAVAQAMRGALRPEATLGRLGGEEFCVLLPDTDIAGAALVAERMRMLIDATPLRWQGRDWPLSASFGIAEAELGDPRAESALSRADAALYRAKHQGRNVVQA